MPLTSGTRLGAYEIISTLGAGGMGEVYRARDARLDRQVAIKVLPDAVVDDPDRLARFEREAKVLAALNHPLIAHVYGFEQIGDRRAIVMELVEGFTLEERLAQGPLAIPDALRIARQLAEALETAHDLGIIHRDLKPANIKLMVRGNAPPRANDGRSDRGLPPIDVDDCTVKVLDFGLAKALDTAAGASGNALNSPTITARATELGTILGTAAYMSPEQARGKAVDRRADVWAFGVVCYEMLTGSRLFKGEDVSDTMAAVLRQPIDLAALPPGTPSAVRTLLERCLEREPRQRLRDIGEARVALERIGAAPAAGAAAAAGTAPAVTSRSARTVVPWILLAHHRCRARGARRGAAWAMGAASAAERAGARHATREQHRRARLPDGRRRPGRGAVARRPHHRLSRSQGRTRRSCSCAASISWIATELAGTESAHQSRFSRPTEPRLASSHPAGLKTMPVAGGAIDDAD